MERFPQTEYDAWWEVAQLYDRKLDDSEKARRAYASVPSSASHQSAAQKRLKKLGD